jgi:hypothetical protein
MLLLKLGVDAHLAQVTVGNHMAMWVLGGEGISIFKYYCS